jgi:hypothetical protein
MAARWESRFSGYLALLLVVLMCAGPGSEVLLAGPLGLGFGIFVWALSWLFAISGVRRSLGKSLIAGWISLLVLAAHAGLSIVVALH